VIRRLLSAIFPAESRPAAPRRVLKLESLEERAVPAACNWLQGAAFATDCAHYQNTGTGHEQGEAGNGCGHHGHHGHGQQTSADIAFLTEAAQGDVSEVMLGGVAVAKGSMAGVRDFGLMLLQDHAKALGQELPLLRGAPQSALTPTPEALQELNKLAGLSGTAFDQEFLTYMVRDHQKDIATFQDEAQNGKDPAARAFAQQQLPVLQKHLDTADALLQSLNTSSGGNIGGTSSGQS
jgi:putative membrane protein